MLAWANRSGIFCFLDNFDYAIQPHQYDCLLGVGVREFVSSGNLAELDAFIARDPYWVFGHLSYELKNQIHQLKGTKEDRIGFPVFYFFKPQIFFRICGHELLIEAVNPSGIYQEVLEALEVSLPTEPVKLQQRLSQKEYLDKIGILKDHIAKGNCYEINFCHEFYAQEVVISPLHIFLELTRYSPHPFSAFYKLNDHFLMCASPERFLKKTGRELISQPMKGTARRDLNDRENDKRLKNALEDSAKDRAENVMVVDMVRNDLSKICEEASVKVEELYGVYTFPFVHQMVSTIKGCLKAGTKFSDIIEATFPMGSMTGAPKHKVMELIDDYEVSSRGIFSGSVGYIDPAGDFDFNVVIRSIMYQQSTRYLSYQVGSGITFYSDPISEWEECQLKGAAMKNVLGG